MIRNIILILTIAVIVFFVSWILDLNGSVEILVAGYKINSSVSFILFSLIFSFVVFYLLFNFIFQINHLRYFLQNYFYHNPKRVEKKINKEQKKFISKIAKILKEINKRNFSKAQKIEANIESDFYSDSLKSEILLQMSEENSQYSK